MGKLHDMVKRVDALIERKGLPFARTKGLVVIRAGFSLVLIDENTPDDPEKAEKLREAVRIVLGESL